MADSSVNLKMRVSKLLWIALRALGSCLLGLWIFVGGRDYVTHPYCFITSDAKYARRLEGDLPHLLESCGNAKECSKYIDSLQAIAKRQGWERQFDECKDWAPFGWEEARAVLVGIDIPQEKWARS
ncbi:MAG: hypothetical protein L0241_18610 [Planctomycetia bacterium]|nr:hypothetical protein [Planctomycetia bacterium]